VFVTDRGTPYRNENIERSLEKYLVVAKLPKLTPHELRHSWNNFARAVGMDPETRAALAGHLPSVNQDTYSHSSEEERRAGANLIDQMIPA
jgi:integrase